MFRDLLHFFVGCFVKRHKINPDFSLGILYRYFFPGLQLISVIDNFFKCYGDLGYQSFSCSN